MKEILDSIEKNINSCEGKISSLREKIKIQELNLAKLKKVKNILIGNVNSQNKRIPKQETKSYDVINGAIRLLENIDSMNIPDINGGLMYQGVQGISNSNKSIAIVRSILKKNPHVFYNPKYGQYALVKDYASNMLTL